MLCFTNEEEDHKVDRTPFCKIKLHWFRTSKTSFSSPTTSEQADIVKQFILL